MPNKTTVILSILLIFIILIQYITIQHYKNDLLESEKEVSVLSSQIEDQNNHIKEMQEESAEQLTRVLLAQEQAGKERDAYMKKVQDLMAQKVSVDCKKAMAWGAKEGRILYRCWHVKCQ